MKLVVVCSQTITGVSLMTDIIIQAGSKNVGREGKKNNFACAQLCERSTITFRA